jgi:hypothetical protein
LVYARSEAHAITEKPPTDKLFEDLIFELHRVTRAWPNEFPAIEEFLTKRLNTKNK